MKTRMEYTCPLELTHDVTKGKWKPIILWQLGKGRRSLSSLKKRNTGHHTENADGTAEGAFGIRYG